MQVCPYAGRGWIPTLLESAIRVKAMTGDTQTKEIERLDLHRPPGLRVSEVTVECVHGQIWKDMDEPRVREVCAGQEGGHDFKVVLEPEVVVAQVTDRVGESSPQRLVAMRLAMPLAFLICTKKHPPIGGRVLPHNRVGFSGRAVSDDEELEVPVGLPEHALDRSADQSSVVERGDEDGEAHGSEKGLKRFNGLDDPKFLRE